MALTKITPNSLNLAQDYAGMGFGGTGSANQLDDYEEGDFTSTCKFSDALGSGNESTTACSEARYTKIGRVVFFHMRWSNIDTTGMTSGNQVHIHGLPFTASGSNWIPISCWHQSLTGLESDIVSIVGRLYYRGTVIRMEQTTASGTDSSLLVSNISSGSSDLELSGFYFT